MDIQPDVTNVALWQRYRPFYEKSEDWQSYASFKGPFGDNLAKRLRFLSLAANVRRAPAIGAFAECGCLHGHSTHVIASTMKRCGRSEELVVFDSFEGLSPATAADITDATDDLFGIQKKLREGAPNFVSPLENTMANLREHKNIVYFPGWIPERFAEVADNRFAFVHIDVDLYEPIKDSLAFFFPRLVDGGVIQIDDYNFTDWPGATKAVDEFLAAHQVTFFFPIPLGGALLVK